MAETVQINEELLYPGDVIRFDFLLTSANETLRSLAIKKVKAEIYADDRLDYQGSEIVTEVDKTGLAGGVREIEVFRVYAQVREYRRDAHPEIQKAGIGPLVIVTVVAATIGALAAYTIIEFRGTEVTRGTQIIADQIEKIRMDPNLSDEAKQAAINALVNAVPKQPKSIGAGLASLGGGLVTLGIVLAVIWALSYHGRPRGAYQ